MAAPTTTVYARAKAYWGDGSSTTKIDWVNDNIKAIPVSSSYVPNFDTDAFLSNITAGYRLLAAVALTSKAWTKVGAGASAKYAAQSAKVSFGAVTARGVVIYKDTGTEATSLLLCYILLDSAPADFAAPNGLDVTPDSTNGWLLVG